MSNLRPLAVQAGQLRNISYLEMLEPVQETALEVSALEDEKLSEPMEETVETAAVSNIPKPPPINVQHQPPVDVVDGRPTTLRQLYATRTSPPTSNEARFSK